MPESSEKLGSFEELARTALLEITPATTVGTYAGQIDEGDGAVSVLFDSAMPGYPDWKWTVSIATVEGEEPTVLEAELMPGEGALLAPDWVPWSDRLAEYKAAQGNVGSLDENDHESGDVDSGVDDSEEPDEDDVLGNDVLHGGDLDGVDIDDLDSDDPESDEDDADEWEKSY